MTFDEFINNPRSEKITLVKAKSSQFAKIFQVMEDGLTYYRDVDFFIDSVKDELFPYVKKESLPLLPREYFFDAQAKRLYLKTAELNDPRNWQIVLTYQHFFSTAPVILPYDLSDGEKVEFEPLVDSIGSLGQQLDDENTGVVLESSSSVKLINSGSYFDGIYDVLTWENKEIEFYLWGPQIPINQAKKIFSGVIESKSYGDDFVGFTVKDFVFKLQGILDQPVFTVDDGRVQDSILDSAKRRIYGRVKQMKCLSVSAILEGYENYGTITGVTGDKFLTGTGFLSRFSSGDTITIINNDEEIEFGVDSVDSDTQVGLSEELEISFSSVAFKWTPVNPFRQANRTWNISGHKLFEVNTEILNVLGANRFEVDNTDGLMAGDSIFINSSQGVIRRISGNEIVTANTITPLPVIGDTLLKSPIYTARDGIRKFVINRDYTLDNTEARCNLVFNSLAEFNVAKPKTISYTFTFTSSSRSVTTSATTDLRQVIFTNDWIKQDTAGVSNWYEVLEVREQEIILRTPSLESGSVSILYKNIEMINDESLITVDCIGLGYDFGEGEKWVKTPSDVARHLLQNDAQFTSLNVDSFNKANEECEHTVSLITPALGNGSEKIKDVLTKINNSCFGSVYQDVNLNIAFSILNSKKPDLGSFLKDDDILDWSSDTSNNISNETEVNYRPYVDLISGEDTFEVQNFNSGFVDSIIGISKKETREVYLYDDDSALTMAQRISFFNSLSLGRVTVKTKLNLHNKSVNDKLYISLDRLFKRYGGRSRRKIGVISSIKKDGFGSEVTFNDLGNVFNRVPSICPDTEPNYPSSDDDSRSKYGYIVDDLTLTPDSNSELELGNNLIG